MESSDTERTAHRRVDTRFADLARRTVERTLRGWLVCCLLAGMAEAGAANYVLPDDEWQLLAVPAAVADDSVGGLFADSLPLAELGRTWAVFSYDPTERRYHANTANDRLAAGQAFWIKQRTGSQQTLRVPAGKRAPRVRSAACASSNGCFSQPLQARAEGTSWMLIGAPFEGSASVADLRWVNTTDCTAGCSLAQAAARGYTSDALWSFDASQGTYTAHASHDHLPTWQGAWLAVGAAAYGTQPALLMPAPAASSSQIQALNEALGNGINLGNALEVQKGEWGLPLDSHHFDTIASAGFDSVRVPVRWSAHAAQAAPYTIEPAFFERIDWVIREALRTRMRVVINMHHYESLMADPQAQRPRYLQLWHQIASRYAALPDTVYFELLNEPEGVFNDRPELWNTLLAEAVATVRRTNPTRPLIVGPVGWNAITHLDALRLPDDPNLITTVHFYEPFKFTHQGADWVEGMSAKGIRWEGTTTRLGAAFKDWSWDTQVQASDGALSVTYQRQYAGFDLRLVQAQTPSSLSVTIRGLADLNVMCGSNDDFTIIGRINHAAKGWASHRVSLQACKEGSREIILQNRAAGEASFQLRQGQLCSDTGCHALVSTDAEVLQDQLEVAYRWGRQHGRPLYVGEFGTYGTADMASRANWTAAVHTAIVERGMSSAYWEFASGFGAWDPATGSWRTPLLKSLAP